MSCLPKPLTACLIAALVWAVTPAALAQTSTTASTVAREEPAAPALRPPLAAWIKAAGLAPDQVGVAIAPLPGGPPVFEWNSARAYNPASTMKLVTSYAALSLLGPEYRWRTSAYLQGRLQDEVLQGDLILKGGGDPKLVVEDLTEFVARMRRAGLRELRGDLVIDDSLFDVGDESVERFDGDPSQPYNVRPHALLMNFKAARVVVQPGPEGAQVSFDPPLAGVAIDNDVRLVKGACRHGAQGLLVRDVGPAGEGGLPRVRVSGPYSSGCGQQGVFTAMLSHRDYIHAFFKAVWEAAGGVFTGQTRIQRGVARGRPWLQWVSPRPLAEVVRDINKFSNNVMTRNLLLQLGAEARVPPAARGAGASVVLVGSNTPGATPGPALEPATPASPETGRQAVTRWLRSLGLSFPELVIENGSGLSRQERISPANLALLLQHAAASPVADLLRDSLPVVGVDGTMRTRLTSEPVAGQAWMKTGSLNDVRSLAGYLEAASGRRYALVLLINGPRAESTASLQDQLLRWLHANG